MMKKYNLEWFVSIFDEKFNKAITKFMIEAACICGTEACRVVVTNTTKTFDLDFTLGDRKISDEEVEAKEENLMITFYELRMNGLNGAPQLERHDFKVVFVAVDGNGERNIAVENSMYHAFESSFFQALDLFPDRFIKDSYYRDTN